jgi:hypothetical protein
MKLRTIAVYGLFGTFEYQVDLCSESLSFIHSPNGYGKSTLVKMVYSALHGDVEDLSCIPFERMDLGFGDDTNLIIENYPDGMLIQMQKNQLEQEIAADELREIMNVTYIPPERLTIRKKDGRLVPALEAYYSELSDKIRYAMDHSELVKVPAESRRKYSDDELVFWSKDLKAKLDFIADAGFEPDMPSGYRFPPSRYEVMEYREDYTDLAFSLAEYVDRNYTLAESIVVFKDVVNGLYVNKDLTIEDGKMGISMENGMALPLNKLSSGEKQVLVMFYCMLFHTAPGSLVIIDEPEISMHVSWQQKLGTIFSDIARLRDLQVIVATHSPQVIHDRWDCAHELGDEGARVSDGV